jgi:pimeloyl-ACP methyl ester carboxylesterase
MALLLQCPFVMKTTNKASAMIFGLGVGALSGCFSDSSDPLPTPVCEGEECDGGQGSQELKIASDLPDYCKLDEVMRIQRPAASDDYPSATFSYGFRFKAPTTANAPVIVYMPGGPGSGSMQKTPDFVPEGWGYLMTDPRGIGCNRLAETPTDASAAAFFRTSEISHDIVAAIKERQLGNYVLFGHSYGTTLATTVANEIENNKQLSQPKAVVLEGVLGRAFGADFVGAEFIKQWERIRTVLPADIINEFDTKDAPYGIQPAGWATIASAILPSGPDIAAQSIAGLSTLVPAEAQTRTLNFYQSIVATPPHTEANEVTMYRYIACREIGDTVPASDLDVMFERGHLVRNSAEEGSKCGELHTTTPYDAAKLQFNAPVYYFIGDSDVATPPWQGAYHFDTHQGHAVRIITKSGGQPST